MTTPTATPTQSTVIPGLRYRDAPAAIEWLCRVFGFREQLVVPGENGTIAHAQLVHGNGMIMLGSGRDEGVRARMRTPEEAGGVTQSIYVVVKEIDAHYEQARAEGATIAMEIEDPPQGGRLYAALDPEGHLFYFGSYDPWA